jgi:hypothetical protein
MAPITTQFDISHSQYYLVEMNCMEATRDDMYVGFNGLISAHEFIAIIMTGTENGHVSITADWRETEPPLDLAPWDDVVEVSMTFDQEPGCLAGMNETDGGISQTSRQGRTGSACTLVAETGGMSCVGFWTSRWRSTSSRPGLPRQARRCCTSSPTSAAR